MRNQRKEKLTSKNNSAKRVLDSCANDCILLCCSIHAKPHLPHACVHGCSEHIQCAHAQCLLAAHIAHIIKTHAAYRSSYCMLAKMCEHASRVFCKGGKLMYFCYQ